jgi:RNA polymerase sigma-70 factor, ECF subfamily
MVKDSPKEITLLLKAAHNGDREAYDKVTSLVYAELRRLAHRYMRRERPGHPLQTTELVHEAWMRLIKAREVNWQNRAQFYGIAAKLMRQILVDIARSDEYVKNGGKALKVSYEDAILVPTVHDPDVAELNDALNNLAELDSRKAKVVELKFFGGLTIDEIAEVLDISKDAVKSDWRFAKAWLLNELNDREKKI